MTEPVSSNRFGAAQEREKHFFLYGDSERKLLIIGINEMKLYTTHMKIWIRKQSEMDDKLH